MKFNQIALQDALIIESEPYKDYRGAFSRLFCARELEQIGHRKSIVQINHSLTRKTGTVRGMHFQYPPFAEIKIVKCLGGSVFDVVIDLRRHSPTFLKWHGEILSADNMKMMYVPEGFAHGFQTLEDYSELLYLHTEFYSPEHEDALRFDDPVIGIKWPVQITETSKRDRDHLYLDDSFEGVDL